VGGRTRERERCARYARAAEINPKAQCVPQRLENAEYTCARDRSCVATSRAVVAAGAELQPPNDDNDDEEECGQDTQEQASNKTTEPLREEAAREKYTC